MNYSFNFYLTFDFDSVAFLLTSHGCLSSWKVSCAFFGIKHPSWGQAGKEETHKIQWQILSHVWICVMCNSVANIEPCLCVQWWLWGEQALMATRAPTCRAPVVAPTMHGPCWSTHPASQMGTPWPLLWPWHLPACRFGLVEDHRPVRTYPESESSLNVAQMVITNFCPFLYQTPAFFFFFFMVTSLIFISPVKENSTCSGELGIVFHPHCLLCHWLVCCARKAQSCVRLGARDAVYLLLVLGDFRDLRNSGRGITSIYKLNCGFESWNVFSKVWNHLLGLSSCLGANG